MVFKCCVDLLSRNYERFTLLRMRTVIDVCRGRIMLNLIRKYPLQQSMISDSCSFQNLHITSHPSTTEQRKH